MGTALELDTARLRRLASGLDAVARALSAAAGEVWPSTRWADPAGGGAGGPPPRLAGAPLAAVPRRRRRARPGPGRGGRLRHRRALARPVAVGSAPVMRPRDSSPLADHDPVPGDPAEALRAARHLRNIADEVDRQAAELRALSGTDGMTSEAVDALQAAAAAVAAGSRGSPGATGRRPGRSRNGRPRSTTPKDWLDAPSRSRSGRRSRVAPGRRRPHRRTPRTTSCGSPAVCWRRRWNCGSGGAPGRHRGRPCAARRRPRRSPVRRAAAALHAASHGLASAASWVTDLHHLAAVCSWVSTVSGVLSLVFALVPGLGEVLALTSLVSGVLAMLADAALAARGEGQCRHGRGRRGGHRPRPGRRQGADGCGGRCSHGDGTGDRGCRGVVRACGRGSAGGGCDAYAAPPWRRCAGQGACPVHPRRRRDRRGR